MLSAQSRLVSRLAGGAEAASVLVVFCASVVDLQVFVMLDAAPASCARFAQDKGGQSGTLGPQCFPIQQP